MKKKVTTFLVAATAILCIGFIGFKVGYNEGALKTASKYNNMAGGWTDQFGNNAYILKADERANNVETASHSECYQRYGSKCIYTGKFLLTSN